MTKIATMIDIENEIKRSGCLDYSFSPQINLPSGICVPDMSLEHSEFTYLPKNLTVWTALNLRDAGITVLPENLNVGWVEGEDNIQEISAGSVFMFLDITDERFPQLKTIADDLIVTETMVVTRDDIKLPAHLRCNKLVIPWDMEIPRDVKAREIYDLSYRVHPAAHNHILPDYEDGRYVVLNLDSFNHMHALRAHRFMEGGLTYYPTRDGGYIVTDGTYIGNGGSKRDARIDMQYEKINKSEDKWKLYEDLSLDRIVTAAEAILMYGVIVGVNPLLVNDEVIEKIQARSHHSIKSLVEITKLDGYRSKRFRVEVNSYNNTDL